jgi:hypothetical protein
MPTLRFPNPEELPPEDRVVLDRMSKRMGRPIEESSGVFRAQSWWPSLLEANHEQVLYGFRLKGQLPELTKQAMHVAISMTNRCEF